MKVKNLIILIIITAGLVGMAYWTRVRQPVSDTTAMGKKVFPALPINEISRIDITSVGTNITLAKLNGTWRVRTRYNYPADFNQISDAMLDLSELKVGQTFEATPAELKELTLLNPGNVAPEAATNAGTLVELFDDKDRILGSILIGKNFLRDGADRSMQSMFSYGGFPEGKYIKTTGGKVVLVSKTLGRLTEPLRIWLKRDFINLPASDIEEISVSGPERTPFKLTLTGDGNALTLEGLKEGEGIPDSAKISRLGGAFTFLGFDDIADPALTPKETGLDDPVSITARTRQGRIYSLKIGKTLPNDSLDRYCRATVSYEAPAENEETVDTEKAAEETRTLNEMLSPWIYVIKSYRMQPLLLKREDLLRKPEPAESGEAKAVPPDLPAAFGIDVEKQE